MAYDGSIFTYFAPGLFILEKGLSYDRDTLSPVVEAQIQYAADQGYEAWGISDCFGVAGDGYAEQGAPPVASPNSPEGFLGLVTPHASVLALNSSFGAQAVNNLEGSALN
jgi:hypothetical protein